jgi:hypothetical protein
MTPPAPAPLPDVLRAVTARLVEVGRVTTDRLPVALVEALTGRGIALVEDGVAGPVLRPTSAAARAVMARGTAIATAWSDAGQKVLDGLRSGLYRLADDLTLTVHVGGLLPTSTPHGRVTDWERAVVPRWAGLLVGGGAA